MARPPAGKLPHPSQPSHVQQVFDAFWILLKWSAAGTLTLFGLLILFFVVSAGSTLLCAQGNRMACSVEGSITNTLKEMERKAALRDQQDAAQRFADSLIPAPTAAPISASDAQAALRISNDERNACLWALKNQLKDPDSLRIHNDVDQQFNTGMIEYTATNSFGGPSREIYNCHDGTVWPAP